MRIIAGERKGMKLVAPPGRAVRPSSDKLRGAVMSQLGGFLHGERMLDVCAGTGAMALEALSRGAATAVAIEQDPEALQALRTNAQHTRLADRLEVLPQEAVHALRKLAGRQFDLVYVDPPYDAGLHVPILQALLTHDLLAAGAQVVVESRRGLPTQDLPGWRVVLERRYGSSTLQRLERDV